MKEILLTTFNARYTHTSIAQRYLFANLEELQEKAKILEFVINSQVADAAEEILSYNPKIVGIGAYIWNALEVQELISILKKVAPHIFIVLGGPEASHFPHRVDFSGADYIIQGEGDIAFYELCQTLLEGHKPNEHVIKAPMVHLNAIKLPYDYYTDHDIKNRYCYVEASRGCPFTCEFCLSSADKKVRDIEIERFIGELEKLWQRGVRNFKFIDRTFNLSIENATKLLDFFLAKTEACFVHFEVIPDHFPSALREKIAQFPPAALQLEVGIQTLDPEISKNIHRRLNIAKIEDNLAFLQQQTHAHLHVDLIIGLPGESLEGFGRNLDKLYSLTQCEIQIGILKKLSGTTISRHDEIHGMKYCDKPPYDILQNNLIPFKEMQKMKRFARFWDMVYNSGNFKKSAIHLWHDGKVYDGFYAFSEWLYTQTKSTWQISLDRLAELIFRYLCEVMKYEQECIKAMLIEDIMTIRGRKMPSFLRENYVQEEVHKEGTSKLNKRQLKHATV
ncbi:radical SAM domain protein [Sulfurospirillum diekertiae]|uniref:Radical SAM domain protein n=1 Tax=Sulfurospirillum diekertiae TaxID=1854492 RepID=A0A290HE46_9BACT|nr:B12-binding domain-containing radical SAM protein [Sulfurospirillum diekertiae]ATB69685.1 radical SAM domain protein [Sulfurospirillum diekertiae]